VSYDICLDIDTGAGETVTALEVGNYTSNVAWMWSQALGHPLRELDGRGAADTVDVLTAAVAAMRERAQEFRAQEPENGWGDYQGALGYLERLLAGCQAHPATTIRISS
jgi:hypothetical protein